MQLRSVVLLAICIGHAVLGSSSTGSQQASPKHHIHLDHLDNANVKVKVKGGMSRTRYACGMARHNLSAACKATAQTAVMAPAHVAAGLVGAAVSRVKGAVAVRDSRRPRDERASELREQKQLARERIRLGAASAGAEVVTGPYVAATHVSAAMQHAKAAGVQARGSGGRSGRGLTQDVHDRIDLAKKYKQDKNALRQQNRAGWRQSAKTLAFEAGMTEKNPMND